MFVQENDRVKIKNDERIWTVMHVDRRNNLITCTCGWLEGIATFSIDQIESIVSSK